MEIVTGSTGQVHVTPIDDAVRNGNYGYLNNKVVFTCYENLSARAITANQVRVFSGYGMNQGRLFKIDKNDYDNVTIENGSQGYKRADLIVARYTMDSQTGFEDISLEVIKGQSGSAYVDPSYTTGNINNGADFDDFPLYRVKINGLQIEAVEQMFTLVPDGGRLGVIEDKINTNMKVNLASESTGNLDNCYGVSNLNLGVSGALPVAHGGTGANSLAAAAKNIVIDNLAADTGTMAETTEFITSESGGGFTTALKKRTFANIWASIQTKIKALLGMGSTEIVSVVHGGTGKGSVTNGSVLVGNGTGAMTEKAVVTVLDGSDNSIPTAKAVGDAMGSAGYGDMMKSVYTNQNDKILESKGGIGDRGIDTSSGGVQNSSAVTTAGALYATKVALQTTFQAGVDAIYNAIRNNGVTPSSSTPSDCVTAINNIRSGGDATAAQILKNKTAYSGKTLKTGTMENRGAWTSTGNTANASSTKNVTIPAGYHNGSGYVQLNSLSSQTSANATAAQILKDKTAWVNGSKVTGTMTNRDAYTSAVSSASSSTALHIRIPQGAYITNGANGYPEVTIGLRDNPSYTTGVAQGHADTKMISLRIVSSGGGFALQQWMGSGWSYDIVGFNVGASFNVYVSYDNGLNN